ncbi:MAG TPA: DinB family protein [Gemmatimonadaceae bacterium]|nr:DinB family protein [Gemmatimonadaceae bacterium]
MAHQEIARAFIAQSRWLLATEYPTKLRACIAALPPDALWRRAAPGANSVGNLLLHLSGNVRQWIISGVDGAPDTRTRSAEFAADGGADARELMARLEETLREADAVLARLTPAELLESRTIQGRALTVLEAIYHVTEHFGMHTGQIILLTKLMAPGAIAFYEDAGGLAREAWREMIGRS